MEEHIHCVDCGKVLLWEDRPLPPEKLRFICAECILLRHCNLVSQKDEFVTYSNDNA